MVWKKYVFIRTIVDRNRKKTHPAGLENTAIPQFKIEITEMSPSSCHTTRQKRQKRTRSIATSLFSVLLHVRWNVANYHNKIHSFERRMLLSCITESEGLRKPQNLPFCVQVFSADTEFHDLNCREHKLGVLYCVLVKTDF